MNDLQVEETWNDNKKDYKEATQHGNMVFFVQKESWQSDGYLEATWTIWVTVLLPVLFGSLISQCSVSLGDLNELGDS